MGRSSVRLIWVDTLGSVLALACASASGARPSHASHTATAAFVRTCASEVSGDLGPPRHWQPTSILVGPFAFVWIRQAAAAKAHDVLQAYRAGQGAFKVLALIKFGHQVTVTVPTSESEHVALLYTPSLYQPQTVANGEQAVTFQACPGAASGSGSWVRATQFNGGIIVDSPRCVTLTIRVAKDGASRRITAPFGTGACGGTASNPP
jgi:hypothetical protein